MLFARFAHSAAPASAGRRAPAEGKGGMMLEAADAGSRDHATALRLALVEELQRRLAAENLHIPIIFITAHGDQEICEGTALLRKPFSQESLLGALRSALARPMTVVAGRVPANAIVSGPNCEVVGQRLKP